MKVFYINSDSGDGSSCTHFYNSLECIEFCCDEKDGFEEYWDGDGGSWNVFEVPDGTVITGIIIHDIEYLKAEYSRRGR